MPRVTPIFRLPFLQSDEILTQLVERTRFLTIDRQLEALYAFLGDGVISGWELTRTTDIPLSITISPGSGVVSGIAAKSDSDEVISNLTPGTASGNTVNFIYAQLLGHTPFSAQVDFISSTTFFDSDVYLILGRVITDSNNQIVEIDTSETSGRKELTFINFILSIVREHIHTGAPGEPSKIDLQNHVKGVLDSSNIGDIPAAKIKGGIISPERFKLSHKDLSDIGTLTHEELDSLVEKLQQINRLLFGDLMTANLMQLYLSFKHVWPQVDEFTQNFFALIPGIGNNNPLDPNSFIDLNATTAELDFINHRIRGRSLAAEEAAQATISSEGDWRSGNFDETFIRIFETNSAYGYGYGGGEGIDFFDVFETNQFDFLTGSNNFISFAGNMTGYGVADLDGFDFESTHVNSYSYGYGFEYAVGFPTTLTSTIVTLNPLTQLLDLHDKELTNPSSSGNEYPGSGVGPDDERILRDLVPGGTAKGDFIRYVGQVIAPQGNIRRSDTIDPFNDGVGNIPDDLYPFFSFFLETGAGGGVLTDSDRAAAYLLWENPVDMTINNVMTFRVVQAEDSSGDLTPFDEDWRFDHSFQLIIEASDSTHRAYYLYKSGEIGDRFFFGDEYTDSDSGDLTTFGTRYFKEFGEFVDGRNRFELSAQIDDSSKLEFITAFNKNTDVEVTSDPFLFTTLIQNITGFMLYTDVSLGHDNIQDNLAGATYVRFPQGRRERLNIPTDAEFDDLDAKMLADIDKVFIGGPFGFSEDPDNNDITDLIIAFPDRVNFNTISWISDEPGDSVIWIQINRLEEDSSNDYRTTPIYTNNPTRAAEFFPATTDFRGPGDDFLEIFQNIRGVRIRVVIIPTTDRRVAPTINSITVNYTSKTLSNSIIISTEEDWLDAREIDNVKIDSSDEVSIDLSTKDTGKIQNVLYGTDRTVVEVDSDFRKVVKRYTGTNLPVTVSQQLNAQGASLSGLVTDLKKRNNGQVVVLDRDESRVIFLNQNYDVEKIIASEKVFLTNDDPGAGPAGDIATLVKATYHRGLSDNGILYLVFSHQLEAFTGPDNTNVDPSQIFIKSKGQTIDLSGIPVSSDNVIAADRGIISLKLTADIANFIEAAGNPILQLRLEGTTAAVTFESATNVKSGRIDLAIEKIGTKGVFTGLNLIYAPIQGVVSFDVDDDDNLLILKRLKPYAFDTDEFDDGVWYARFSTDRFWTSWNSGDATTDPLIDPNIETNLNTIRGTESDPSLMDPNFFVNNFFGHKGSLERFEEWLLFTFPGDKKIFITKKDDLTEGTLKFRQPTELTLPDDGTTPMAARFDPDTTTADDFRFIYIALSDLRRGSTDNSGKSKVIKSEEGVVAGQEIVWRYGAGEDERTTQAVTINDVHPLVFSDNDGVIVST